MKDAQDGIEQVIDTIPLFKTCYSRGKSIIHIKKPKFKGGHASLLNILPNSNLSKVFLVEDNMGGFIDSKEAVESLGLQFIFGWRLLCKNDGEEESFYKFVLVPKNKSAVKKLYKIYTHAFSRVGKVNGYLNYSELLKFADEDFVLCVPFYDSFIFNNSMNFSDSVIDFQSFGDIIFFSENNDLPFDHFINQKVNSMAEIASAKIQKVKTIYYENRSDFKSFQLFKIFGNRSTGRKTDINKPEFNHFSSAEFSFESWLESK
jgi:DNA polymerase III alpha subunit